MKTILSIFGNLTEFELHRANADFALDGFSVPESFGRWNLGTRSKIRIPVPAEINENLIVLFEMFGHLYPGVLDEQTVTASYRGEILHSWNIRDRGFRIFGITIPKDQIFDKFIEITLHAPNAVSSKELDQFDDERVIGFAVRRCWTGSNNCKSKMELLRTSFGTRFVGTESRKTYDHKLLSGFWSQYLKGPAVLDIGFASYGDERVVPISDTAIGVDIDYPGYDGRSLPFADNSQDAVYSSHCLEHIPDFINAIQDWYRVTKVGGHIIIAVPSRDLYERRRRPPSNWNHEHLRMYTCASLLHEIEMALKPNSFKVRYLLENDEEYDYDSSPDNHAVGNYEISVVIEKIAAPIWQLAE